MKSILLSALLVASFSVEAKTFSQIKASILTKSKARYAKMKKGSEGAKLQKKHIQCLEASENKGEVMRCIRQHRSALKKR